MQANATASDKERAEMRNQIGELSRKVNRISPSTFSILLAIIGTPLLANAQYSVLTGLGYDADPVVSTCNEHSLILDKRAGGSPEDVRGRGKCPIPV